MLKHNFKFSLECVYISRGRRHERGGAGRARNISRILTKLSAQKAESIARRVWAQSQKMRFHPLSGGSKIEQNRPTWARLPSSI